MDYSYLFKTFDERLTNLEKCKDENHARIMELASDIEAILALIDKLTSTLGGIMNEDCNANCKE